MVPYGLFLAKHSTGCTDVEFLEPFSGAFSA
jgi:hypothetical protein